MKIGDVQLGTEYTVTGYRTNVTRAKAVQIVTRPHQGRQERAVQLVATKVARGYGREGSLSNLAEGNTLILSARDLGTTAAIADAEAHMREERERIQREAIDALDTAFTEAGFPGLVTRYGRAAHATFSPEEAREFAQFLTATVTKAREFDLTEAEIQQ